MQHLKIKNYFDLIKEAERKISSKNYQGALDLFDEAISVRAESTTAHYYKAELFFALNRDEDALQVINQAGQIEDNLSHTYLIASRFFHNRGKLHLGDLFYKMNRNLLYGKTSFPESTVTKGITKKHLTIFSNKEQL